MQQTDHILSVHRGWAALAVVGSANTRDNCAHGFAEFCLWFRHMVRCWTLSLLWVSRRGQVIVWSPPSLVERERRRGSCRQLRLRGEHTRLLGPCDNHNDGQQGPQRSCIITIPKILHLFKFRCHASQETRYFSQLQFPVLKMRLLSPS